MFCGLYTLHQGKYITYDNFGNELEAPGNYFEND